MLVPPTSDHRQDWTPDRDSPSLSVRSPCTTGLRFERDPWGGDEIVGAGESLPTKIHLTRGLFLFSFLKINFISYCFISALIVVVFRTPKSTIFNNFRK